MHQIVSNCSITNLLNWSWCKQSKPIVN